MPRIFMIIGSTVPQCHEKKGLDQTDPILFVVKVVQELNQPISGHISAIGHGKSISP